MYPSINIEDGQALLRHAITYKCNLFTEHEINFIMDLANWVLTNNYFEFGINNFYHQIKGTAMGTPFAVTFACIYMSILEIEVFSQLSTQHNIRPIVYKRVFAIFVAPNQAQTYLEIFNNIRKNQINYSRSNAYRKLSTIPRYRNI